MAWTLIHSFLNDTCVHGVPLRRASLPGSMTRQRAGGCPVDHETPVSTDLPAAVAELLHRRGINNSFGPPANDMLYCLGGPDLYRRREEADASDDTCVDLVLKVCDQHQTISFDLYPYDLVPERGGSGPNDPRQSSTITLPAHDPVDKVLELVEEWLNRILLLPR